MAFVLPDLATEDQLLVRLMHGDRAVLTVIYEQYFPAVYQFIRLRVEEASLAEDIASEVFLKLIDLSQARRGPRQSLRGWLFRVTRNELARHYGKTPQLAASYLGEEWNLVDTADDLEIQFIHSVEATRAQQALRMLAPDQQDVLLLRFVEGLSLQETADVLGKSINAIKSLQFRAINTLRQILGELRSAYG